MESQTIPILNLEDIRLQILRVINSLNSDIKSRNRSILITKLEEANHRIQDAINEERIDGNS